MMSTKKIERGVLNVFESEGEVVDGLLNSPSV